MASAFDTTMTAMNGNTMTLFGEDVTYTPQGGAAKTIKAIVKRDTRRHVEGNSQDVDFDEMEIDIRGDDDTLGETTPKEFGVDGQSGDSVSIDSVTWYVAELLNRKPEAGWYHLRVKDRQIADPAEM